MIPLAEAVDDYLAMRRALGYQLAEHGRVLPQFAAFLAERGESLITTELALEFATQPADASVVWWHQRLAIVRGFARYLQAFDARHEVPPVNLLPATARRAVPYLFSETEIEALLEAARSMRPPLRAASCEAVIGLLAVSGMRVSEACGLDRSDVELPEGRLTVRHAKNGRSREIPLHPTTVTALDRYEMTGVSCPTTTLCVAVDAAGNVITSRDPAAGGSSWTVAKVDVSATQNNTDNAGSVLLRGVSCPSTALCVAVDAAGNALVSTAPSGGAAAWATTHIDTTASFGCTAAGLTCQPPLVGVSCPSTALCMAVDFSGNLLTSAAPTRTAPWTSTPTAEGGLSSLWGISCPVVGFCATVDGGAGHAITLNPAHPSAHTSRSLPYALYGIWCPSPSLCLASAETPGGISGLLGSFDPAARASTWSLSSLGGVNAVACPGMSLCFAADDEGNVAAGVTTKAITTALRAELLSTRHLPRIAALGRRRSDTFVFTSPIAAQVTLVWTAAAAGGKRVTVASMRHGFNVPGRARITLRLSPAGRRLFKAGSKRLTLTATATFAASTGQVSLIKKLTFTH